jgi:uncharacterized protein
VPDPLDVLRREPASRRPDPRFAVSLRRRLEEELGMTLTDDRSTPAAPTMAAPRMVHIGVADADRAMRFYGDLLGWESERVVGDDGVRHYVINTERVEPVLVAEPGYPEVRLGFHADDPAAAVELVRSMGGEIEEVDPETGRWFLATDPVGTPLVLWRPGGTYPHAEPTAPARGELTYFQIDVPDADAVLPFYSAVLGWAYEPGSNNEADYHHVDEHTQNIGMGIQGAAPERRVRLFFGVDDLDEAERHVRSLGGDTGERYEWGPMNALPCTDDQGTRFVLAAFRPR